MGYKGWEDYDPNAPKKAPKLQMRGLVNRTHGASLEDLILTACEVYRVKKIAEIDKTPEPFKVLTGIHRLSCGAMGFEGVFAKKAQPDFQGTLSGGRSVVFEAKMTITDRITQDEVNKAQTAYMNSHDALGAVVFVLVSMNLSKFYRVPWDVWKSMKERYGRKYMKAEDLAPFEISFKNGILMFI